MPTINENIAELQQKTTNLISAHNDIKDAIISKGGKVSSGDKFSDFPDDIGTIRKDLTSININENGVYKNGTLDTVTGNTYPIEIVANGSPIVSITMDGDTVQNETPTPTAPVDVNGVGVLETIGEHSGQYKIPILCGNQTTNIYLGSMQSTRQIKKLVLTGKEAIEIKSGNAKWYISIADMKIPTNTSVIEWYCSHYQAVANNDTWTSYDYMISWSSADSGSSIGLRIRDIDFLTGVTVDDFKSYLAAQYVAGTPVTIWYVLATPETGVVNEPLMKIGDYKDQLTLTDSDITIPTVTGNNVVDYNLTIKPSSTSLTYYKLGINKTIVSDTLPIEFESNGNPLESYSIMGNTVQNGTPTPSNPIQPQSCGERTAQLFDKNNANIYNAYMTTSHEWILSESAKTVKIQCEPNTVYTLSVSSTLSIFRIYESANENIAPTESGVVLTPILRGENKTQYTFTTSSTAKVLIFQGPTSDYNMWFNSLMLNLGSTALPYEPYGIKIPILCGNQTTNIYLGETQSTRAVKKLVLTGDEEFTQSSDYQQSSRFRLVINDALRSADMYTTDTIISTHYKSETGFRIGTIVQSNGININSTFCMQSSAYPDLTTFKSYLSAQYAAGTPVTIWYVLATPETATINEPLMKIGDYADSIVDTQTQIPTVYGDNTFDVGTTIKPSSVSITYDDINTIGYNEINVDVPNTYTVEDEGKVVNNSTLVAQTAMPTEITANDTYDTTLYNSIVVNVPTGGSTGTKNDVTFYDYDGTIVTSYSKDEFANLSALPANPSHEGLTAQGWNWSLSDAKTYVNKYGKLDIGQMYVTSDGKTRLYITLTEDRTSPILQLYLRSNSELDIDWGDGTHSTFTSTTTDYVSERHNYSASGDYVIAITVVSGIFVLQSSSSYVSSILWNGNNNANSPDIAYNNSIKKVEIGTGVTKIGDNAFNNCYSLSSITIPDSVTGSISQYAFQGCYSLKSVTIPNRVAYIRNNAFYYCTSLTSITIPNRVRFIDSDAFYSCYSLSSITIPDSVTSIYNFAFGYCQSLSSITIPDSVGGSISQQAFQDCSSLTSIIIGSEVTSIGQQAFMFCYSLTSITIGNSVTSIGSQAFQDCSYMELIKFISATPPTVSNSGVWTSVPTTCTILVPINTYSAYTTATNYPDPSSFTYLVYGTYASGDTLPSTSTDNYSLTWYATIADAIAQTNPITTGNGNEVYARCVSA